jgi:hypothetical protein
MVYDLPAMCFAIKSYTPRERSPFLVYDLTLKLTKPQKLNYEQLYDDERTVDFPRRSLANSTGARPDFANVPLQIRQDLRICCRIQGLKTFCRKS